MGLLQLVMIVKNAESCILETLKSYKPYISSWVILDTGSEDNTCNIIRNEMKNVVGKLFIEKYDRCDFEEMRNKAFDLAKNIGNEEYMIMPDDSYILNGGDKLLKILELAKGFNAFSIKIKTEPCEYFSVRIVRKTANLRWTGRIHEVIEINDDKLGSINEPGVFLFDRINKTLLKRSQKRRLETDIATLLEDYNNNPHNKRTWFYIAMTYIALINDYPNYKEQCLYWLKKRHLVEHHFTNLYDEEAFESGLLLIEHDNTISLDEKMSMYFMRCMRQAPSRAPEAMYKMALEYYNSGDGVDDSIAYGLLQRAYQYPMPTMAKLFVNMEIYKLKIPDLLFTLACKYGNKELAKDLYKKLIQINYDKYINLKDLLDIDENVFKKGINLCNINGLPNPNKETIIFVAGTFYMPWNGDTKTLGGSEYMLSKYAEYCAKGGYNVYAFVDTKRGLENNIRGVQYLNKELFYQFIQQYHIKVCIVSRKADYLKYTDIKNIENVYFWCHDIEPQGKINLTQPNFRKIICLTNWHKEFILNKFKIDEKYIEVSGNCIDLNECYTTTTQEKIKRSFIYTSAVDRGLEYFINIFPDVLKEFPDATLHVFCDLSDDTKVDLSINKLNELKNKILSNKSIIHHNFSDHKELYKAFSECEYWIYPDFVFKETFCITALEAQIHGCIPLTTRLAALNETVNKCIELKEANLLQQVIYTMNNPSVYKDYVKLNIEFAKKYDIGKMGKKFLQTIKVR